MEQIGLTVEFLEMDAPVADKGASSITDKLGGDVAYQHQRADEVNSLHGGQAGVNFDTGFTDKMDIDGTVGLMAQAHTTATTGYGQKSEEKLSAETNNSNMNPSVRAEKSIAQAKIAMNLVKMKNGRKLLPNEPRHMTWKPAPTNTTSCSLCNSRAMGKTIHQQCQRCSMVICRECVEEGLISALANHVPLNANDFDWGKMRPSKRQKLMPMSSSDAGAGAGPGIQPGPVPQTTAVTAASGSQATAVAPAPLRVKGRSRVRKNNSGKNQRASTASLRAHQIQLQGTIPNTAKPTTFAPVKRSSAYIVISDSDDDEMDAGKISSSESNHNNDEDYLPPGETSRKRSTSFTSVPTKRGGRRSDPRSSNVAVGLANSRPVRAAAIDTYEKMRNNTKTERVVSASQKPKIEMGAGHGQRALSADDIKPVYQSGSVVDQTDRVYYPHPNGVGHQFAEHYAAGDDPMDFDNQQGGPMVLPKLHPGSGMKARGHDSASTQSVLPAVGFYSTLTNINNAPTQQKDSGAKFSASEQAVAIANDDIKISDIFGFTKKMVKLTNERIDASSMAKKKSAPGNKTDAEKGEEEHLLDVAALYWFTNNQIRRLRDENEHFTMTIFRACVNLAILARPIKTGHYIEQWLNATLKEIQDNTESVPEALRVQHICPVPHNKLSYPVTEKDINAANGLMMLRYS